MTGFCAGQLGLFPDPVEEEQAAAGVEVEMLRWARENGWKLSTGDSFPDPASAYRDRNGPPRLRPGTVPHPDWSLRTNFSGYPAMSGPSDRLQGRAEWYLRHMAEDPEDIDRGLPISGDATAFWAYYQHQPSPGDPSPGRWMGTGRYRDIAHVLYPGAEPPPGTRSARARYDHDERHLPRDKHEEPRP